MLTMLRWLRALLAQNRRLADLERRMETLEGDVRRRELAVAELHAAYEFLDGDLKKLRGRITGGLRKKEDNGDTPAPPPEQDKNELIKQGRYRRRS